MDFYAHQERARVASRRLTALFALSLAAVVGAVNAAAVLGWLLLGGGTRWPQYFFATNTLVTLLIVFGGAWVEWQRLREGGAALAERLGARPIDDSLPLHRRLRDVAEEVSIGAGAPVPSLHVLDDDPINALAAGERPGLAAVIVTRGALERLQRAELQGVVAHEIAHIVGGDAELNVRLAAALYGLSSLRLAGYKLLGSAVSREPGPLGRLGAPRVAALVGGALLSAVGMLGVVAAQLLKAGISRQREFLADALAVQITRDRDGLGCALRRIAGEAPAPLRSGYAAMVSHFLLVQPVGLRDWFDTHPPLAERIARLYGRRVAPIAPAAAACAAASDARATSADAASCCDAPGQRGGFAPADTIPFVRVALPIAAPFPGTASLARADGGAAPATSLQRDSRSAAAATALITQIRSASLGFETAGRWLVAMVAGRAADEPDAAMRASLDWLVSPAGASLRVPLLELLLARIRRWSSARRRELLDRCRRAVEADGHVHSAEWIYYTLARHRLSPNVSSGARQRRVPNTRQSQSRALAALFAMAAAVGEASARATRDALVDAAAMLEIPPPASTPDEVGTTELALALDTLLGLPPLDKPILLKVLFTLARTPGDPNYEAFVRAVAAAIDCPVPRGAGQQVGARRGEPAAVS
ncbi:MAG: M48 family metalloprotease [Burkholderiaceae bacterium]|nr:M48 family metalloprotease [Burkholderiaceae bacterium]